MVGKFLVALLGCAWALCAFEALAGTSPEYNPVRRHPVAIGPQANRLIVAFRTTADNAEVQLIHKSAERRTIRSVQARTTPGDVAALAQRTRLLLLKSRQLTPSMHVLYLRGTLYGADLDAALNGLRADPAVKFADADQRRYPHAVPDDPLYQPSATAAGQWYMMTPSNATPTSIPACASSIRICCAPASAGGCCRATISSAAI
jgi:hypothetical protein